MAEVNLKKGYFDRAIGFFDKAFMFEKVLMQLKSVLFRLSALEILCFFFNILWFCGKTRKAWYVVIFVCHIVRAFFGLLISFKVPYSHQVIDSMGLNGEADIDADPEKRRLVENKHG